MDGLRPGGMTENEDEMILSHATMDKSSNVEYGGAALVQYQVARSLFIVRSINRGRRFGDDRYKFYI